MIRSLRNRLRYALFVAAAAVVLAAIAALAPPKGASADETLVTPEGVTINVRVDTVTAQQVYEWLLAAGLEPHVKLTQVDVVDDGMTMASVGGGCYPEDYVVQGCWVYNAKIQVRDDLLVSEADLTLGHEYGHVWENYYRWIYWHGEFDAYLEARGLLGDPRLGSSACWQPYEIIAEDYRQFFGSGEALTARQCNRDIPAAADVPGLRDFLALTWTDGNPPPGYSGAGGSDPTETPTPEPTSTPTPDPTPTPTPTPTPEEKTPPGQAKKDNDGGGGGNGKGNGRNK